MRVRSAAVAIAYLWLALPLAAQERLTVVELFTSQGCPSCPPADALLGELSSRSDILPLSEHVDYWDYLGWKDPFASSENTRRQRAYARRFGLSYVYTPQIVVHGNGQVAGADRDGVLRLIGQAKELPVIAIEVNRSPNGEIIARLQRTALPSPVDVWLVRFDPERTTAIEHGENVGRRLQNYNVVRGFTRLAMWNGEAISYTVPALPGPNGMSALLLQQGEGGRIVGTARFAFSND